MMLCGNCADGRPEECSKDMAEAYGMNMALHDDVEQLVRGIAVALEALRAHFPEDGETITAVKAAIPERLRAS